MISRIKPHSFLRHLLFVGVATLFYTIAFGVSEFYDLPFRGLNDFVEQFAQWGIIIVATFGLIYLLSLSRWIFAIVFPLLSGFSAFLTYFRYTFKVSITPMAIDLAFVNDFKTNSEVISPLLILVTLAGLAFGSLFAFYRYRELEVKRWWIHLAIALGLIWFTNGLVPRLVRPVSQRLPYSIVYSFKSYFAEQQVVEEERADFSGAITSDADSLTVVFVIGESLRPANLGFNGYHRNTTPHLGRESNLVSLGAVYTQEAFTHVSIPQFMTRADSVHMERAYSERSFISLFNRSNYHTAWLANQESVVNYVYFMNECDTISYANSGKTMYVFDKWLDEDLLPLLDGELARHESNKLIIMHTIGSHWWYNSHYSEPFERYTPVITSRVLTACTPEELINSYDNTVLYTDHFLHQTINRLRDRKAILIYLSDHGEALGEAGMWAHGADYPILHQTASFVWYSDGYAATYPEKVSALKRNSQKFLRTDYLFHSIQGAGDITSSYRDDRLNLFN